MDGESLSLTAGGGGPVGAYCVDILDTTVFAETSNREEYGAETFVLAPFGIGEDITAPCLRGAFNRKVTNLIPVVRQQDQSVDTADCGTCIEMCSVVTFGIEIYKFTMCECAPSIGSIAAVGNRVAAPVGRIAIVDKAFAGIGSREIILVVWRYLVRHEAVGASGFARSAPSEHINPSGEIGGDLVVGRAYGFVLIACETPCAGGRLILEVTLGEDHLAVGGDGEHPTQGAIIRQFGCGETVARYAPDIDRRLGVVGQFASTDKECEWEYCYKPFEHKIMII